MPRLKATEEIKTDRYSEIRSEGFKHETNDCTVIAVTKVCGVPYEVAHAALKAQGRKEGRGAVTSAVRAAVESLGFQVIKRDPKEFIQLYPTCHQILQSVTTHHPHRFNKVWKDGKNYLFFIRAHVAAVINGENGDWCRQHAKRVRWIYEIVKTENNQGAAL